jgi:DNA-binding CsgD family transcriptional regulator
MLLERERELGLLGDLLAEVDTAGGTVTLIRGEAGIGKSALVRAFLASIGDAARTHVGFCDDLQTPQPFGPLWDMAREESDLREALLASDRQQVMEALFDLLARSLRPNLVVIEDTQWSDEATLDAIKHVGRRIDRTNGLLLLTYRDEEVDLDHPLRMVLGALRSENLARIELGGLSRVAVAELLAESELDPDTVLQATRGNPFFVTEMALTIGDEVPASVRDSVMARVGRLSILAREMLRYISVIPERTTRDELAALVGSAETQLAECERAGLLDVEAGAVAFRHELIRRAVEGSLTVSERAAVHRALLDVLPDDTDPARLVHHARGANDVDRLIEAGPLAARAAADVGGNREASAHYRALEPHLDLIPPAERARLLSDWASIEYYMADVEATRILDEAIDLYRDLGATRDLARALTLAVAVKEAHALSLEAESHALEAIRLLEQDGPSFDLASALSRYADFLVRQGDGKRARAISEQAIAIGEATGNEQAQIRALTVKGMLAYARGIPDGLDLVEEARSRAERNNHRFEEVMALLGPAFVAQEINDVELQADLGQRARAAAVRYELPLLEAEASALFADSLMRKGSWAEADDLATENLGSHANADMHFMRILGLIRMRTGRSGAEEYARGAWSLAEEFNEIDDLQHVAASLAEKMWLESTVDRSSMRSFRELVDRGFRYDFPWRAGWLAFWLWMLEEMDGVPDGTPEPYAQAMRGDAKQAAMFWADRRMPYQQALALACGDVDRRREAVEILDSLGADVVAAKLRKDLRDEGVTLPRGKGRATREHAAGLTARQAEVLQILGEGLTNPEVADRLFLSPRTVENHVSAILAKLDATTREEAVEKARSAGLI